jgi:crossover junction endodeoxyribonuclease RuvC
MKVLGIDPGYDRVGVAIVERTVQGEEVLIYSSHIETPKTAPLSERLYTVGTHIKKLLETHTPDIVAIETLFFNKNVKTAIGVAHARGIIVYLAKDAGCSVYEFGPQEIKVAVTGYGKSDKKAIIHMIRCLVRGAPHDALDDEYDAIGVALTALAHNRHGEK